MPAFFVFSPTFGILKLFSAADCVGCVAVIISGLVTTDLTVYFLRYSVTISPRVGIWVDVDGVCESCSLGSFVVADIGIVCCVCAVVVADDDDGVSYCFRSASVCIVDECRGTCDVKIMCACCMIYVLLLCDIA